MESFVVISLLLTLIILVMVFGIPLKFFGFIGQGIVKLTIGALLLFALNFIGGHAGIHVPINLITAAVSGFLGIPGVLALAVIRLWILP
ncbi:pro-sigmaK processing inhibitor BofA family protein [Caldibacillus debilis]|uniref:Pro-sigmaK processing inhibitor BofA n=1 Tax=Caldibacillus debilis TaxID=301148 RepID=A0A150M2R3_9BACI|nr:pro-sigmaK processing inhibitor BofA family protein [Caldibacillus debilis]KYD18818.1 hypothetical protein B4135_0045 [Caldibacillus debilis]